MLKSHYCGELRPENVGQNGYAGRLGAPPPRPRRPDLPRPSRLASGIVQVVVNPQGAPDAHAVASEVRNEYVVQVSGTGDATPPRHRERRDADRRRSKSSRSRRHLLNAAKTPPFYINEESPVEELAAPALPLPRPAPRDDAQQHRPAQPRRPLHPPVPHRPRLHRDRDADPGQRDAGGRPRLPGAQPGQPGQLLRPAAVAAAVQAAAHGRGLRALLPDRELLPRRRPARRPPAGVHAARPRDELRQRRRTSSS